MDKRATLRVLAALSVMSLLTACFVSEDPLLNERNAKASALWSGGAEVCTVSPREETPECNRAVIAPTETGSVFLVTEDDERTELRFRRLTRNGWLAQANEAGDEEGYFYLVASRKNNEVRISLMDCDALPEKLRTKMIEDGELISDATLTINVCSPQSLKALERVGRLYLKGDIEPEGYMVLRPVP